MLDKAHSGNDESDRRKFPPVIQAMLRPEFYCHPATFVELKQAHTSYVVLAGEFAYKIRLAI
jgi:aminoglycoside phosphotransferase family enzyme